MFDFPENEKKKDFGLKEYFFKKNGYVGSEYNYEPRKKSNFHL